LQHADKRLTERGLAAARLADDSYDLSRVDCQVDTVDRPYGPAVFQPEAMSETLHCQ
jgi:hypothetical protein